MYPVLFEIGGLAITSFGLMIFIAFIVGGWVVSNQLGKRGLDPEIAWDVLIWIAIGGILGAKLYYLGLHWRDVVADPAGELTSRAGLVWYGGLIGGIAVYFWQVRKRRLPAATMFDATAPALAIAYALGRVGCFLVGDDYGLPTDSWAGIAFPNGAPPSTAGYLRSVGAEISASVPDAAVVAVHPTQLYEVAAALVIFAVLLKVSSPALRAGRLFGLYLILYGIERFLIEFVRAKGDRIAFGLSTSQVISILIVGVGVYLYQRQKGPRSAARPGDPGAPASTAAASASEGA